MSYPVDVFRPLSAALVSGSIQEVLACLDPDATIVLQLGTETTVLTGAGLHDAAQSFFSAFESPSFTAVSRSLSGSMITEEAVFSGNHVGPLGGIQPTHRRVTFNVRLVAEPGPHTTLNRVWVEPDTRVLLAQIADTDDVIGVTGGLISSARERAARPVRVTGDSPEGAAVALAGNPIGTKAPVMRRWHVGAAALLLVLGAVAFFGWRVISSPAVPLAGPAVSGLVSTPGQAPTASLTSTSPSAGQSPSVVVPPGQPVIKLAGPQSVPKVQPGRQVVLSSDVLFGLGSAQLTPSARTALQRLAQGIRESKVSGTIQVNGYTDATGTSATNVALSLTRALAVARELQPVLSGLQITLIPQGFGEANPIAPNSTSAGQARNRRVTIVIPTN